MEINELLLHRKEMLSDSENEDGSITDSSFLNACMQYLHETKLTDTDVVDECYCVIDSLQIKVNAYLRSDSEERLQLFIVNEDSLTPAENEEHLLVSQKQVYEKFFSRALNFVKKATKSQLDEELQDSSPGKGLAVLLASAEGMESIDVVEVFVISATISMEPRGATPTPRRMDFEDEMLKVNWVTGRTKMQKEITVIKRLIDVNFLYEVSVSQGNRLPLVVDFSTFKVECIQAAEEKNYESYLCILPAPLLVKLYHRDGSRMLEKNVRSFLQLKNSVNKGIQDTIRNSPEKFIAYNNGLTITATAKTLKQEGDKTYIESLTDFQIVNGGQTTATIYFSDKAGLDIKKVRVMAKINVAKNASEEELEDLITRISEYSNAQSRVSAVDLRSRNSQLVRLKTLSESVITPSGKKWFFERAKGEFNTLVRKEPNKKNKLEKEYPKERRFTKEELAKYFTAWGENPNLVKKGGEKVFRLFIENISGDGKPNKQLFVDRNFYEETIAKIILFKSLEKLHGSGADAIGQLRSAVVPYSISVLYKYTTGDTYNHPFKLTEIWKKEGLDESLLKMMRKLMTLMNKLIKKYADSDDYGEYSKKPELWNKIKSCSEIRSFVNEDSFARIISRYCTKPSTARSNEIKAEIDFAPLYNTVDFFSESKKDGARLKKALDFIVEQYEAAALQSESIASTFANIRKEASAKGIKDAIVFSRIGKNLSDGILPDPEEIQKAAYYTDLLK